MKYIVILGDGMADYPMEELGGKTPLQTAKKPNIDSLAKNAVVGMVKTIPDNMKPGSDVANLAVMGYNPNNCYTGRSPLEAVGMGISMSSTDIAVRCNFITLSNELLYEDKTMIDYCAGEISTSEADQLIQAINKEFHSNEIEFFSGISYRHCMIWKNGPLELDLIPPHDISNKKIKKYLPKNQTIADFMKKSYTILKNHSINEIRRKKGLPTADSIWLWGEGGRPSISNFYATFGLRGSVIAAVDLIKGIGICAGLNVVEVSGATGNINTNFRAKGETALKELLNGQDFVYIHVEAPDECSHRGEIENKILSIEKIDEEIVGTLLKGLKKAGENYRILIMPDHSTPISLKTHVSDPVPFLLYKKDKLVQSTVTQYDEESGKSTKFYVENGYQLIHMLI